MEEMTISKKVENIIERRKRRLPALQEKRKLLTDVQSALETFERESREMFNEDGFPKEGRYKTILEKYPDIAASLRQISVEECEKRTGKAIEDCDTAIRRFSREKINISVIGQARIGKSEFLKSISDLSNYVIPAFTDSDCTGAVSVISNSDEPMKAKIEFKTEGEIIDTVQEYLDNLIPNEVNKIRIFSLQQIRDLDIEDIEKNRMVDGRAENNQMKYLKKFVEHYSEWSPLVAKGSIELYDEKEIQTYVAQNNGKREGDPARKDFYKYLAVKVCNVSCPYNFRDAGAISLIDTVGFEDNSIGIEDELMNVVSTKSDAVVFMLFPLNLGGGGVPKKIADIYRKIETSCRNKNLDKWLFWLINYAPQHPVTPNTPYFCEQTLKTLTENQWHGDLKEIVDAHNQEEVRKKFLIPLLEILINGLDDTDKLYLNDLADSLRSVQDEYSRICSMASNIFSKAVDLNPNINVLVMGEIDELFNTISSSLKAICSERKQMRDVECPDLEEAIDGILNASEDDDFLPSIEDIKTRMIHSGNQNVIVYVDYCNALRNDIVSRFAGLKLVVSHLLDELKNQITKVLTEEVGLKKILSEPSEGELYEWLKEFSERYLDEKNHPHLKEAFENLYSFDFSINGFLTYEVRACLDRLDPDISGTPALKGDDDNQKTARLIRLRLDQDLIKCVDSVRDRLQELIIKPNRAMFAVATDFRDAVVYAENAGKEWRTLFLTNARELCSDVYAANATNCAVSEELQAVVKQLTQYNGSMDNFKL